MYRNLSIFILTGLVLASCSTSSDQKIVDVKLGSGFYKQALNQTNEEFSKNPKDDLLRRKLYYLKLLGWPEESLETLQEAEARFGLTDEIVHNLAGYYLKRNDYEKLRELLRNWKRYDKLDRELSQVEIDLFISLKDNQAEDLLLDYSKTFKEPMDESFVVARLGALRDTTSVLEKGVKLIQAEPNNMLVDHWIVPVLLKQQKYDRAISILKAEMVSQQTDLAKELLAQAYLPSRPDTAKIILQNVASYEAYLTLVNVYEVQNRYDSAVFFLDKLILQDSSRNLIYRKAEINEKRRWLNSAYYYYNMIAEADSTDTLAQQRAFIVAKKIAYLRSLKELEKDVPILDLKPKKEVENE